MTNDKIEVKYKGVSYSLEEVVDILALFAKSSIVGYPTTKSN